MNGRPLVSVACCWVVGVSIGSLFQGHAVIVALFGLLSLLLGLAFMGTINARLTILCGLALVLAYGERFWVEQRNPSDIGISAVTVDAEVRVDGHIASTVEVDGDLASFRLRGSKVSFPGASQEQDISRRS